MKIGIMTFHRAANYGAVLQAYALQCYLAGAGNEAEVMDYRCKEIDHAHAPFYMLYVKGWKNKVKQFLRLPVRVRKRRLFDAFLARKIPLSIKADRKHMEVLQQRKYDAVIAGSDQIWNPDLTQKDMAYLLDFVPEDTVKISYAASFGTDRLDEKRAALYKKYLDSFDKLSVREQQGAYIIRKLCGKAAEHTADPTFLLQKEDWERFMTAPPYQDYILLYMIKYSDRLFRTAQELAGKTGKQLVFISDSMKRKKGVRYVRYAAPEEWTGLLYHAACVVTNSFHGTAFSIHFNKRMIVELANQEVGKNARITGLLDKLAIEYDCRNNIIDLNRDMDWEAVNAALAAWRESSRRFLQFIDTRILNLQIEERKVYEEGHTDDRGMPV